MKEKDEFVDEKKEKKKEVKKEAPKVHRESKNVIRLLDTNIESDMKIGRALMKIRGIGFMFSNALCISNNISPVATLESLSEDQIRKLEESIKNPVVPKWMLNRRKDMKTGNDIHITSSDIDISLRDDLTLMKKMRCYKGIRHELGLPVRGQSTKSCFRKNKTVGVVKKKAMPAKAAPKAK
jgi:small subunit ribosomal protein S13